MSSAPRNDNMGDLFGVLCDALSIRLKSGEATAADLEVCRKLLNDNGINCGTGKGSPLEKVVQAVPFPTTDRSY